MTEHTTATFDSIDRRQFLRAGVGVAGTTVALSAFTGTAAAHFPNKLTIDIKPKSDKNQIVLGSGGTITVAVLQTDGFNPTSKPIYYRFGAPDAVKSGGGARPAGSAQLKDVNGDGEMDLILEFPLAETGFDGEEKKGKLVWERHKGAEHGYSGTAPVIVIGGEQPTTTTASTQKPTTGAAPTVTDAKPTTGTGESTAMAKTTTTASTANSSTMTTTGAVPTATNGESTTASAKSTAAADKQTTTAKTTTTTAQGPGFGLLTALGGIGGIAAYLFTRYTNRK